MPRRWLALLVLCAGCASAPVIRTADRPVLAAADEQVRRGCYDCLLAARDAYEQVAVGRARPLVRLRLFETNLLIAARERELALDVRDAVARARIVGRELPPTVDPERYVSDVLALPWPEGGTSRAERVAFIQDHHGFYERLEDEAAWIETGPLTPVVRTYLALAVRCSDPAEAPTARRTAEALAGLAPDDPPLVRYRAATCGGPDSRVLPEVRARVPAFVETAYFLGRDEVNDIPSGRGAGARQLVFDVFQRFPDSPAVVLLMASYEEAIGDWTHALQHYDQVLAVSAEHEDAWLGRTICLTRMTNRPAAIEAATHMIERRFAPLDTALYWRAVNEYDSGALSTARADIDAARRVRLTNETLTLAGIIEHDQGELPAADRDLRQALNWMSGNCTAAWYVGSVAVKRQAGEDAATYFEAARFCYQNAATQLEGKLDRLDRNTTADPAFREWQRDQLRRDIRTAHTQSAASAVNAASAYLFLGNYEAATRLLDAAGAEPSLTSDISQLRHEVAIRRPPERASQ